MITDLRAVWTGQSQVKTYKNRLVMVKLLLTIIEGPLTRTFSYLRRVSNRALKRMVTAAREELPEMSSK